MNPTAHPHRKSLRLPEFDYSLPGEYFITTCTWKRELLFASSREKQIVETAWAELLDIFGNLEISEYVVMPNHFHGIIRIIEDGAYRLHPGKWKNIRSGKQLLATTEAIPKFVTLGSIVGAFKTSAASYINRFRKQPGEKVWQRNYFERVIRNEHEAEKIREYILLNPQRWVDDRDNPESELFGKPARSVDDYLNS